VGALYVVATPIGNLGDMSARAVEVLRSVDIIAAEDTRHSKRLLDHYAIDGRLVSCHDHNEADSSARLVAEILAGRSVALISDAGTPLVSDPGYRLVQEAIAAGVTVIPVPGPSAMVAALSVAGLPTDRFCFEGFLPARLKARLAALHALRLESRTLVLFEAPHRVAELLRDMIEVMGEGRRVTVARELTKQFEQVWRGSLAEAAAMVESGAIPERGEFVIVLEGAPGSGLEVDSERLMEILLRELPPATAAGLASEITGIARKRLYEVAVSLKKR
jgi:16S rRNA (cytidine1402-2'-O)-methyltransferase